MKRTLLAVLLVAVLVGGVWAAYERDITGVLRKDAATMTEAVLKAIEYIIDNGVTVNAGTNLNTSALATNASVDGLEAGFGTATTVAVDGDAAGSAVAHLRGINKKLAAGIVGSGTAGTAAGGVLTVQGVANMTPILVTETSGTTPVAKTPTSLAAVIIGTPGTPVVLAADATYFRQVTFQAGRAAAANASAISIGGNTAYTSQRQIELYPGDSRTITADPGTKLDLNDWYIDGVNTDDGVRIEYIAP